MPMGMADALVRLWLKKPEFFTKENLENMKNTDDVPVLEKTVGSAHIATPEEIQVIEQKLIEHQKRGELVQNTSIEEVPPPMKFLNNTSCVSLVRQTPSLLSCWSCYC
jgi:hypothetical protein